MKCLLITCIKVCFLQCVRFYFLLQLLCSFLWIRLFQPFCKFLCILFAVFFGCVRIYICQKFFITCRNGADCTAYICFVFWLTVFFFFLSANHHCCHSCCNHQKHDHKDHDLLMYLFFTFCFLLFPYAFIISFTAHLLDLPVIYQKMQNLLSCILYPPYISV